MSIRINSNSTIVNTTKNSLDGANIAKKETQKSEEKDQVIISDMAEKLREMEEERQRLREMAEQAEKDKENSPYDDMSKAFEIFRRILRGDNVPLEDERFLMKYNLDMYTQAILFREEKEKPKEYESLLDEEDNNEPSSEEMPSDEISSETSSSQISE